MNISYINYFINVKNDIFDQRMYPYQQQIYIIVEMSETNFLLFLNQDLLEKHEINYIEIIYNT